MSSTTVKTIGQPSVILAQVQAPIDMVEEESSNAIAEDQLQKQPADVVVVTTEVDSSEAQVQAPIDMVEEPSKVIAEVQDQVAGIPAAVVEEPSNAIAEDQIQEQPAVVVVAVSTEIESSKAQEQIPIDMVEEPKAIAEVQDQALSSSSENKRKSSENQTANVEESQSPAKKAKTAEEMDALMADCGSPTPTCGC